MKYFNHFNHISYPPNYSKQKPLGTSFSRSLLIKRNKSSSRSDLYTRESFSTSYCYATSSNFVSLSRSGYVKPSWSGQRIWNLYGAFSFSRSNINKEQ